MTRIILALTLILSADLASAASCSVAGTAYDPAGKPLRDAVVRLYSPQTGHSSYAVTDGSAAFRLDADGSGDTYRVDLLSHATVVTGSHIPTRSILGMTAEFGCRGSERQDVRALTD